MFEHPLGISKKTFLKKNVVLANDNDAFNDNNCIVCWDPYDHHHPGVRVLPCNHVFGHGCLLELIDRPNGNECPICRSTLFRPSIAMAIERRILDPLDDFGLFLFAAFHKVLVLWDALPRWLRSVLYFLMSFDNVFYYVEYLVNDITNLGARNPDLNLDMAVQAVAISTSFVQMFSHINNLRSGSSSTQLVVTTTVSTLQVMLVLVMGVHGRLNSWRDRFFFFFVLLVAIKLKELVVAFIMG